MEQTEEKGIDMKSPLSLKIDELMKKYPPEERFGMVSYGMLMEVAQWAVKSSLPKKKKVVSTANVWMKNTIKVHNDCVDRFISNAKNIGIEL